MQLQSLLHPIFAPDSREEFRALICRPSAGAPRAPAFFASDF
jgi:hypothetical protein